jgi:hypothetical protein
MAVNLSNRLIIGLSASVATGILVVAFLPDVLPFNANPEENCRAELVTIFNTPALRNAKPTPVRVIYVFDVRNADQREVRRMQMPAIGSQEAFHVDSGPDQHLITYMTGRIGDLADSGNEIFEMCMKDKDYGFRLQTVHIIGDGIDVRVGPDKAVEPFGRTGTIVTSTG